MPIIKQFIPELLNHTSLTLSVEMTDTVLTSAMDAIRLNEHLIVSLADKGFTVSIKDASGAEVEEFSFDNPDELIGEETGAVGHRLSNLHITDSGHLGFTLELFFTISECNPEGYSDTRDVELYSFNLNFSTPSLDVVSEHAVDIESGNLATEEVGLSDEHVNIILKRVDALSKESNQDDDFWEAMYDLTSEAYPHGVDVNLYTVDNESYENGYNIAVYANVLNPINNLYETDTTSPELFSLTVKPNENLSVEHVNIILERVDGMVKELVVLGDFWESMDELIAEAYPHGVDVNIYTEDNKSHANGYNIVVYAKVLNPINNLYEADTTSPGLFSTTVKPNKK